ncbi:MAG TPA: hypothetical protein VF178_09400, partial [Gemmatimonadaceae bacterium]
MTPNRWAWLLPVAATLLVAGCEDSLSIDVPDRLWGFVFLDALEPAPGEFQVQPEAIFFRGNLAGVPNSFVTSDSCNTGTYTPGSGGPLLNVTYLDAGPAVDLQLGASQQQLDRVIEESRTTYLYAGGVLSYNPGDSVVVTVPGSAGGFPGATIRSRTAEPFTMSPIDPPQGTETIHFT